MNDFFFVINFVIILLLRGLEIFRAISISMSRGVAVTAAPPYPSAHCLHSRHVTISVPSKAIPTCFLLQTLMVNIEVLLISPQTEDEFHLVLEPLQYAYHFISR